MSLVYHYPIFFCTLLFIVTVSCIDFSSVPYEPHELNHKAIAKITKAQLGTLHAKKNGPSARDEYWASMRRDDSLNNTVPYHRYLEALDKIERRTPSSKLHKRGPEAIWTNIGPAASNKNGGRTRSLYIVDTQTIYAGSVSGGLWRTTDGGASWTPLTDYIASMAVSSIAIDNEGTIFIGTGEGYQNADAIQGSGIFKSINSGTTWINIPSTIKPDFYYVNKLFTSPTASGTLYAATGTGVFRSRDSGNTWTSLFSGNMLEMDVSSLGTSDLILAWKSKFGLYRSADSGDTWAAVIEAVTTPDDVYHRGAIAISKTDNNYVYISQAAKNGTMMNVYRSTDAGATFADALNRDTSTAGGKLNKIILGNAFFGYDSGSGFNCANTLIGNANFDQGWYDNVIAIDPTDNNVVYIGGVDLWKSADGGANFELLSSWWTTGSNYLHADHHVIAFSPNYASDSTVFFGCDGGVFKTANLGAGTYTTPCSVPTGSLPTFQSLNNGYATIQFYHGSVGPFYDIFIAGSQDNGSFKFSSGTAWTSLTGGDGGYTAIDYLDTTYPPRGYTSYTYTNIYRHEQLATTYTTILQPGILIGSGVFINPFEMHPTDSKVIYTCTKYLYRTDDATASTVTWKSMGIIGSASDPEPGVTALAVNPTATKIFMGTNTGKLYVATLPSGSPQLLSPPTLCPGCGTFAISSINFNPANADQIFLTISTFGDPHLWRSDNGGGTWVSLSANLPDIPANDFLMLPYSGNEFYLATDVGVLYSPDSGVTWTSLVDGNMINVCVSKLRYQASSNRLFAFTHGRGALVATLGPVTSTGIAVTGLATTTAGESSGISVTDPKILAGVVVGAGVVLIGVGAAVGVWFIRKRRRNAGSVFVATTPVSPVTEPVTEKKVEILPMNVIMGNRMNDMAAQDVFSTGFQPNTVNNNTGNGRTPPPPPSAQNATYRPGQQQQQYNQQQQTGNGRAPPPPPSAQNATYRPGQQQQYNQQYNQQTYRPNQHY